MQEDAVQEKSFPEIGIQEIILVQPVQDLGSSEEQTEEEIIPEEVEKEIVEEAFNK